MCQLYKRPNANSNLPNPTKTHQNTREASSITPKPKAPQEDHYVYPVHHVQLAQNPTHPHLVRRR